MVKGQIKTSSSTSPRSPDRRQRRSADIRERLFRASLDLFAKKGFAETTVEDITNAADVGKGTFFNYFPSKDHLLVAFGEMQMAKLRTAVDEMRRGQIFLPDFLRSLGVRMTEEHVRNPSVIRAILQANLSSSEVRKDMSANHACAHALLTELMQLGQDRGQIRNDLPPAEIAHVFRQTIFGTLLIWAVIGDASLTSRIHTAFDLLWNGISSRDVPRSVTPSDVST